MARCPAEGPAVQAWSRIPVVGPRALEDALSVWSPLSPDPLQSQSQLLSFVAGLRDEGYLPTVLRSRDVYGYTSSTCQVPPPGPGPGPGASASISSQAQGGASSSSSAAAAAASRKKPRKNPKCNGWLRPPASGVRLMGESSLRRHRYPERRAPRERESKSRRQQQQALKPRPGAQADPTNSRLQLLRSKVIKVDDSSSDEEVRRKAQKILRVNLSPVIRISPITYPLH
ncbi:coiled-coil domain-containing protein 71-like [Rhincodon typus]|uniref:coiled-coil domain-containing protein 71-like n=1 Tax=Rhincodon typus TaxID=259920 RepID=UPI00202F6986|nr:coiled-coil domain-containing protein 71-like [Rhincodon typus]XP_048462214.1 coiled-coil domain-containing protein 71-like [Rhincodon typus]XP_048462215.1 coiled-coil domain-containing protein 71-like [Rhincodon typus]XP_048462217.1 coiled-coil domain-containing protein 71-like [Rhincodon typus]